MKPNGFDKHAAETGRNSRRVSGGDLRTRREIREETLGVREVRSTRRRDGRHARRVSGAIPGTRRENADVPVDSNRDRASRRQTCRVRYALTSRNDADKAVHPEAAPTPGQNAQMVERSDLSMRTQSRMQAASRPFPPNRTRADETSHPPRARRGRAACRRRPIRAGCRRQAGEGAPRRRLGDIPEDADRCECGAALAQPAQGAVSGVQPRRLGPKEVRLRRTSRRDATAPKASRAPKSTGRGNGGETSRRESTDMDKAAQIRGIAANLGSGSHLTPDSRTLSANAKTSESPRWR